MRLLRFHLDTRDPIIYIRVCLRIRNFKLTNFVPLSGAVPANLTGAANRRSPVGGSAYGMPRYSETCESLLAGCPETGPEFVWTVCPTVQFDCLSCST